MCTGAVLREVSTSLVATTKLGRSGSRGGGLTRLETKEINVEVCMGLVMDRDRLWSMEIMVSTCLLE